MDITYCEGIPDVDTYNDLRTSVEWKSFGREQSERCLKSSYYCVVAKDGDEVVAMGRTVGDGVYFTIVDVVVRPRYQGKRIGEGIIKRLVNLITDGMAEGESVSVQLIAARGKEGFYVKQGFGIIPDETCGPALRKIIRK